MSASTASVAGAPGTIAIMGAGAVGSYVGGMLALAGEAVVLIDAWPAHVETMRARGLVIETPEGTRTARPSALHLGEVQALRRVTVGLAFLCAKLYDTDWATLLLLPQLTPQAPLVTMQNGLIDDVVASLAGAGRTLGAIAGGLDVALDEPGRVRRSRRRGARAAPIFKVGELDERASPRAAAIAALLGKVDTAAVTTALRHDRWLKLCANAVTSGLSGVSGLPLIEVHRRADTRRLAVRLGAEVLAVGAALGYRAPACSASRRRAGARRATATPWRWPTSWTRWRRRPRTWSRAASRAPCRICSRAGAPRSTISTATSPPRARAAACRRRPMPRSPPRCGAWKTAPTAPASPPSPPARRNPHPVRTLTGAHPLSRVRERGQDVRHPKKRFADRVGLARGRSTSQGKLPPGDTTMRFMMLMIPQGYATAAPGTMPDAEMVAAMTRYNETLKQAGVLLSLDGLHPRSAGARVAFARGQATVTDGPFAETKEVLGGYWMIQVASKDAAIAWARRCPAADGDIIEIRQVFEMSDFPEDVRKAAAGA